MNLIVPCRVTFPVAKSPPIRGVSDSALFIYSSFDTFTVGPAPVPKSKLLHVLELLSESCGEEEECRVIEDEGSKIYSSRPITTWICPAALHQGYFGEPAPRTQTYIFTTEDNPHEMQVHIDMLRTTEEIRNNPQFIYSEAKLIFDHIYSNIQ